MKLFFFPTPAEAETTLYSDTGLVVSGISNVHPSGRVGKSFELPDSMMDSWGARIVLKAAGFFDTEWKGILRTQSSHQLPLAELLVDDVHMIPIPVTPVPEPNPEPIPVPDGSPLEIILNTYDQGDFDLSTKEGCGQFVEAACENLHILDSSKWGHLRKHSGQNQYNGHAVDALNLLLPSGDTKAGVYDIIFSTESPDAKPVFNYAGPPVPADWYYPA